MGLRKFWVFSKPPKSFLEFNKMLLCKDADGPRKSN